MFRTALPLRLRFSLRQRLGSGLRLTAPAVACCALVAGCGAASTTTGRPAAATTVTAAAAQAADAPAVADQAFRGLEQRYGARLGVYGMDTGSHGAVSWRADERFAYASTFKALACAVVLRQDSASQLSGLVGYGSADLVAHSPITRQHVGAGMSVLDLCDAAIRYSDNTAGNLILRQLGGPAGLTAGLRRAGDATTSADRFEPYLNTALPGDRRDTTTPHTLGADLAGFTLSDTLPADRRALLCGWLARNTTGEGLIRAAVPAGWTVGDKTGTGDYGTRNDIAVIRRPGQAPLILAVMSTGTTKDAPHQDALLAAAARVAIAALTRQTPTSP